MSKSIKELLAELPMSPGVYLHKDSVGTIIYVGKAARLRDRVRQYFHKSRISDAKTDLLVADIVSFDWIVTDSEIDALFLEAELVKRYKPKYNIMLRDDKSDLFVRLDIKGKHPTASFTRRPLDDGADYIGPFINGYDLKKAMRLLRKVFPYDLKTSPGGKRVSLDYHIGLSPGLEESKTTIDLYRADLRKLKLYLKGKRVKLLKDIESDMKKASAAKDFEQAARLRDQLRSLNSLRTQIVFGQREFIDLSKDQALNGLSELLGLKGPPHRIEGYDISHFQGENNVASMVVFSSGLPNKSEYRKFKLRTPGNDDFAHMEEVIGRRFSPRNATSWPKPDLLLIDGGKGQLSSVLKVLDEKNIKIPAIGLAKRREQIVIKHPDSFEVLDLPQNSHIVKLLTRIRDESHRFAISYQTSLGRKRQVSSPLLEIPGIGPITRKQLIKRFGSVTRAVSAPKQELIETIGRSKTDKILKAL